MYTAALCVDRRYLVPAFVTLTSLAAALPRRERSDLAVTISSPDITRSEADTARDLLRRLGFGDVSSHRVIPPADAPLAHGDDYITSAAYLRLVLPHSDRPHLLYLDADLLILDDPAPAFDHLGPGQIGVVVDEIVQAVGRGHALPGLVDAYPEYNGAAYFNSGAIWLAARDLDEFSRGSLHQLRQRRRYIYFNDQDALNLWLLTGTQRATPLPGVYNRFELGQFRERGDWITRAAGACQSVTDARILHFVGSRKPWLASCPRTEAAATYRRLLTDVRRHIRRLGDLVLDLPGQQP